MPASYLSLTRFTSTLTMHQISMDRRNRVLSLAKRLEEIATARHDLLLQLEDLDAQEQVVQAEHNLLHNLDATTSNLPDEILAIIFGESMSICREEDPFAPPDFGEVVSHVSHRWRSIALDTPSLWTDIRYNDRCLGACVAYLSRSRLAPVDIYIGQFHYRELTASLLQSIGEHIGHCRSLRIAATLGRNMRRILECVSCHAVPILKSLSLGNNHHLMKFSSLLFPLGAPHLRIVHLVGLDFEKAPQAFCLPAFEAVTHLHLSHVYIENAESYISFRAVLEALQNLSHLDLNLETITPLSPQLPVVLPALKFLQVDFACPMDLNYINNAIHASSLISLSLSGWNTLDESNLAKSYFPSLRHLFLANHVSAALPQLNSLAKVYPDIERMSCLVDHGRYGEYIEDILAAIWGSPAEEEEGDSRLYGRIPWPKMHTIAVEGMRRPVDASALRSIVVKLQGAGSSIHTLLLPQVCVGDGDRDVEDLQDIIKIEHCRDEWPTPFDSPV